MKEMNWKKNQAPYIAHQLFESYGSFKDNRPVLVDCSFGVNPLEGLFPENDIHLTIDKYSLYPSGGPHYNSALFDYVASRWPNVRADEVCFSSGSQGAICSLAKLLGGTKASIQGFLPQFLPALLEFSLCGARVEMLRLAEPDYLLSVDLLLDTMRDDCSAVYIDNPNNPTGHAIPLEDIARLAEKCAERGILAIIDEAYGDFIADENSALNLSYENIICMRSFSKGCGLAGLRIGYIVIRDSELRQLYYDLGQHFSCSALAGDVAAKLLPTLDLPQMRTKLSALKQKTTGIMLKNPLFSISPTDPCSPIVLLGWQKDSNLFDALMDVGIQAEPGHFFGIDDSKVRLRIPAEHQLPLFAELWNKAFG